MNIRKNKGIVLFVCLPLLFLLGCKVPQDGTDITGLLGESGEVFADNGKDAQMSADARTVEGSGSDGPFNIYVHICGEVVSPGVYEVAEGSRIYEVLRLAGGFTKEAAEDAVNLAMPVSDGMQVVIPSVTEQEEERARIAGEREGLININRASAKELCSLPGIGESRAADIIAYREAHGGFSTPEEIMQVAGIKEGMYEKIKDFIYTE